MFKDFGDLVITINRSHLYNWSLGIDYYQITDTHANAKLASVFMVSLLFFNITFTKWA